MNEGDLLLELETDKVTLEVNAPTEGVLKRIDVKEGAIVTISEVLGVLEKGVGSSFTEKLAEDISENPEDLTTAEKKNQTPETKGKPVIRFEEEEEENELSEYVASPSARKLMEERDLTSRDVRGTGREGRIIKEDLLEHPGGFKERTYFEENGEEEFYRDYTKPENEAEHPRGEEKRHHPSWEIHERPQEVQQERFRERLQERFQDHPSQASRFDIPATSERKPLSALRKRIAERLKYAQNTAAILTTFNECDMSAVMELRKIHQEEFLRKYNTKLGFMSFFVRACIQALKEIPAVNAEIRDDEIIYHKHYDIGIAVSAPQGLVVPVLRNVEHLHLSEIEKGIARLAEQTKEGKLRLSDLTGGTFTITNGGVFGSLMSTPILNPPQSGILGMHKIQDRAVVINGHIVIRPMMYLALSYDHRIIDGKDAVTFLVKVKEAIENPTRLLLGI